MSPITLHEVNVAGGGSPQRALRTRRRRLLFDVFQAINSVRFVYFGGRPFEAKRAM